MHIPFGSEMQAKDAIAHELLDLDDEAATAIDAAYAETFGPEADIGSRAGDPDFLNNECGMDIEILTGDAV